jgi:hypothetical protein
VEKDFSNPEIENIGFEYFEKQFETVKNYNYDPKVKIE